MSASMRMIDLNEFYLEMARMESEVKVMLMQAGLGLRAQFDKEDENGKSVVGSRKSLIIEPKVGLPPQKIAKLVCGDAVNFKITIETVVCEDAGDEAQTMYLALEMAKSIGAMMRDTFWGIFTHRAEDQAMLDEIEKIDPVSGPLYRMYAKRKAAGNLSNDGEIAAFREAAARIEDLKNLLPEGTLQRIKEAAARVEEQLVKERGSAEHATQDDSREQILDEAMERADGPVTIIAKGSSATN